MPKSFRCGLILGMIVPKESRASENRYKNEVLLENLFVYRWHVNVISNFDLCVKKTINDDDKIDLKSSVKWMWRGFRSR